MLGLAMLFFVQFPLSDIRSFVGQETGRLPRPTWPVPEPYSDFVRSFGVVRLRAKGGLNEWVGENEICDAHSALTFLTRPQVAPGSGKTPRFKCASKHFFHDGYGTSKFEVVLIVKPPSRRSQDVQSLRALLHLPVRVRRSYRPPVDADLIHVGKHLAQLYVFSSTSVSNHLSIGEKWVLPGPPMAFIELGKKELFLQPGARIYHGDGFRLSQRWFQGKGEQSVPIWLLQYDRIATKSTILLGRALRLYIMRLHAEFACLRNLIRQLGQLELHPETQQGQLFQKYLNEATRRIQRNSQRAGKLVGDKAIGDIAMSAWETIAPGQMESFLQALGQYNIRPQIAQKVEKITKVYYYNTERMIMGDSYEVGQGGIVGPAKVNIINSEIHQQYDARQQQVHLEQVSTELSSLRKKMSEEANTPQQYMLVGEVAAAEIAVQEGNLEKAKEHLRKAGKWALDTATSIGSKVVAELIIQAMKPGP